MVLCVLISGSLAATVQAQVPGLPTPSSPSLPTAPSLPLDPPTLPRQPVVPAPSVPLPPVSAPSLPVPAPALPVPAPAVPAPSLPSAPAIPDLAGGSVPTGPVSELIGASGGGPLGAGGSAGGLLGRGGSAGSAGAFGAMPGVPRNLGIPGIPDADALAQRLATATPRERRRLARRLWDTPLAGKRLARMRRFVKTREACLDILPEAAEQVVLLRTGLAGGPPATRRDIARRLGTSVTRVLRLERRGVVRLARSCDVPAANAFVVGQSMQSALAAASTPAVLLQETADRGAVLGVQETRLPPPRPLTPQALRDGDGDGASATRYTLLAFLAAALALIAAVLLATRGATAPLPIAAASRDDESRPLLFVDVDGVIALAFDPFRPHLHRGAWHRLGVTEIYVSLQAGELLRTLATRFDLVWATGWGHRANAYLPRLLGLAGDLPTLRFGNKAMWDEAEWKLKTISRYARKRPAAWIDDHIDPRQERWAERRSAPTKLVRTDSRVGITKEQVDDLLAWADAVDARSTRNPRRVPAHPSA